MPRPEANRVGFFGEKHAIAAPLRHLNLGGTLPEQAPQLRVFRGFARFRPDLARPVCDADFVALLVEPFEDFVAVLRFGADLDFLAVALAGARLF